MRSPFAVVLLRAALVLAAVLFVGSLARAQYLGAPPQPAGGRASPVAAAAGCGTMAPAPVALFAATARPAESNDLRADIEALLRVLARGTQILGAMSGLTVVAAGLTGAGRPWYRLSRLATGAALMALTWPVPPLVAWLVLP